MVENDLTMQMYKRQPVVRIYLKRRPSIRACRLFQNIPVLDSVISVSDCCDWLDLSPCESLAVASPCKRQDLHKVYRHSCQFFLTSSMLAPAASNVDNREAVTIKFDFGFTSKLGFYYVTSSLPRYHFLDVSADPIVCPGFFYGWNVATPLRLSKKTKAR